MQTLFFLGLLALFAICVFAPVQVRGDDEDPGDVTVLTDSNFDEFINQEVALVKFYAPWCGHCKAMAPDYKEAATILKKDNIPIGKLDATVYGSIASRFGVSGYPTLKVFRNGKDSEYKAPGQGGRKTAGIVSYMKKQLQPDYVTITSKADLDQLIKTGNTLNYVVVGFFNSGKATQLQTSFFLLAKKHRDDYSFAVLTDQSALIPSYVKDSTATEAVVVFSYGEPIVYPGTAKMSNVEEFIKEQALPPVGEWNEATAPLYYAKNLPIAKFAMKADKNFKSKHMKYYTNRFAKLATKFAGKLVVAVVDKSEANKGFTDTFNINPNEEVSLAIENQNKKYKFEHPDEAKVGKVDAAAWEKFLQDFLDDKVPEYVRSERAPANNNGPVTIVTGNNFASIVNDPTKDVLIEFYAPWCGHCKQLEPKYNELGAKLKKTANYQDVVIAKIDATANDYPSDVFPVKGYPSIFFRPAAKEGSSKLPAAVKYEQGREVSEFVSFIKKNAKTPKRNKRKAQDAEDDKHAEL